MRRGNKGFSLIEITVVLTVFGLIISGVFMAVNSAIQSQQDSHVSQQVISMLENIRNYTRHVDISNLSLGDTDICNLSLVPKDISNSTDCTPGTAFIDALGQGIDFCVAAGAANTGRCGMDNVATIINITLANMKSSDCTNVLSKISGNPTDLNFIDYEINSSNVPIATNNPANLTLTAISNNCTPPTGGGNTVTLTMFFTF